MDKYLKILGLNKNFTEEELKKAYRKAIHSNHPDKFQDADEKKLAEEIMREINEANEYLKEHINDYQENENFENDYDDVEFDEDYGEDDYEEEDDYDEFDLNEDNNDEDEYYDDDVDDEIYSNRATFQNQSSYYKQDSAINRFYYKPEILVDMIFDSKLKFITLGVIVVISAFIISSYFNTPIVDTNHNKNVVTHTKKNVRRNNSSQTKKKVYKKPIERQPDSNYNNQAGEYSVNSYNESTGQQENKIIEAPTLMPVYVRQKDSGNEKEIQQIQGEIMN